MSTACPPNNPSTLFSLVQNLIPEAQIDALDRSAWSETEGLEYIHNLAFKDDIEPLKVATKGKFYAISSFAAVSASSNNINTNVKQTLVDEVHSTALLHQLCAALTSYSIPTIGGHYDD